MKSRDALNLLADITSTQWGMVTSAQAAALGISRLDLNRLTTVGQLERLAHGIYKDSGAPSDEFEDLRAAWLSTEPKRTGSDRLHDAARGVVIAGASSARLHQIGDLWEDRHNFVAPTRRQSQRPDLRYRTRDLDPQDVTIVGGLPVMTVERTIADLVDDVGELSLVADTLRDAALKQALDHDRLRVLLEPLAARHGFRKGDGQALLDRLMEIAGVDAESVARRVAIDPRLGSLVAANYLDGLDDVDIQRIMGPAFQRIVDTVQANTNATSTNVLENSLENVRSHSEAVLASLARSGALDVLTKSLRNYAAASDVAASMSQAWSKNLHSNLTIKLESMTPTPALEKALEKAFGDD